jgi:hypothetical protein
MKKENTQKRWQKMVLDLLKDIDMKVDHVIERLKMIYDYISAMNSSLNSKRQ